LQAEGALSFAASGGDRPPNPAEEAFASYLDLAERGERVDFDSFCRAHPALVAELRRLHGHWVQVQSVVERLAVSRGDAGSRAVPSGGAAEREGPWPGAALLERLGRRKRGESADPRYRSQGEISRGGMGAILRVWDEDLRRSLAMKVVLPQGVEPGSTDRRSIGRFLEEAQITGQLDHPGIVPVHELGLDERGRLFFTMRLVQGDHLGEIFRKTGLLAREQ